MGGSVLILVSCLFSVAFCSMQIDSSLTADVLVEMGITGNKALLELVGTAFQDIEEALDEKLRNREIEVFQETTFSADETFLSHVCKLMKCSFWTEWSPCQLGLHEFGMISRTRQCGVNNKLCIYGNGTVRTETESVVCTRDEANAMSPPIPRCPSDYTIVNGKFCLKYVSKSVTQSSATDDCQADGGELIHVDSQTKQETLHAFLGKRGLRSDCIWLNGKRDRRAGPWQYTYGDPSPSYFTWSGGEPSNGSSELCKVSEGSPRAWYDRECSYTYTYVCEIA